MMKARTVKMLSLNLMGAYLAGDDRHAQTIIDGLGISYQIAVPQSIIDSWHFWGCENVPKDLPDFIVASDLDPMEYIGWGLSAKDAASLVKQK